MGIISKIKNVKTAVAAGKKAYNASKAANVKKAADAAAAAKKAKDAAENAKKLAKAEKIIATNKKVKRTVATTAVGAGAGAYAYKKATDKAPGTAIKKGTASKVASKAVTAAAMNKATPTWMKNSMSKKK